MIITVDGPSGTGKSTVAKEVAKKLGFTFFDTGAMYRSIAWCLIEENILLDDVEGMQKVLEHFSFSIKQVGEEKRYFANGIDVTKQIRTPEVTAAASKVSAFRQVREKAWKWQRDFAAHGNSVFEGRDMGSVVFPNADVKIFLTARPEVRAKRRFLELQEKYPQQSFSYDEILNQINQRDEQDSTRTLAPLIKPKDAYEIDTSDLTINQVVDKILHIANQKRRSAHANKK